MVVVAVDVDVAVVVVVVVFVVVVVAVGQRVTQEDDCGGVLDLVLVLALVLALSLILFLFLALDLVHAEHSPLDHSLRYFPQPVLADYLLPLALVPLLTLVPLLDCLLIHPLNQRADQRDRCDDGVLLLPLMTMRMMRRMMQRSVVDSL